jgi:hypothetical protein
MLKECDKMSISSRKTINGKHHKGGYFIYIDKEKPYKEKS